MIQRGYKFRIYPTQDQKVLMAKHFGCARFVYNHFLKTREEYFAANKDKDGKRGLNYYDNATELKALKIVYPWLAEVNSQSLQQSLKALDIAYKNFFRKTAKKPKFHGKYADQSFKVPQHFSLDKDGLWMPKFNAAIKIVRHRKRHKKAEVKSVTISKNKAGQYFASFLVEEKDKKLPKSDKNVGIDVGLKSLAALSSGEVIENPKFGWKARKKLTYLQRQESKKTKGGKNRVKARLKINRLFQKTTNQKTDFAHKLTRRLVNENQVIAAESLNIVGMMQNRKLARSIGEVSWGEIYRQLAYKCAWAGRRFVQVGQFFPSSKLCACGFKNAELTLEQRVWTCPNCGATLDRDLNAAQNILAEGLKISSGGGRPSDVKQKLREASSRVCQATRKSGEVKGGRVYELRNFSSLG